MKTEQKIIIWILVFVALIALVSYLKQPTFIPAAPPELIVEVPVDAEPALFFAEQEGLNPDAVKTGLEYVTWYKYARFVSDRTLVVLQGKAREDLNALRVRELVPQALIEPGEVSWPTGALPVGVSARDMVFGPVARGDTISFNYTLDVRLEPYEVQRWYPITIPQAELKRPPVVELPLPPPTQKGTTVTAAAAFLLLLLLTWQLVRRRHAHYPEPRPHKHPPLPKFRMRRITRKRKRR